MTSEPIEAIYHPASTDRSRAAIKGVLWSLVSSFAPSLITGVVFLVTSRSLGPTEFGLVAFAASIATLAGAFSPIGFGQAIVQRGTIEHRHLDSVFWLCAATSALFYGALWALSGPVSNAFNRPELQPLLPVLGLKIIFDLVGTVPNAILTRTMSFDKMAVRTTVASLLGAAVCLVLLWRGYGIWALAISQVAASFGLSAGAIAAAGWRPSLSFDPKAIRDLSKFGGFSSATNLLNVINLDQILIGAMVGVFQLGLYNFARRVFQMLNDLLASPLNSVSFSLLSSLQSDKGRRREAFLLATFLSALLSFPAFVGLGAIADDLVPLVFGSHWEPAVFALQAFCAIGLLSSIGVLQASLINSHGRAEVWFTYLLIKQVVTISYILLFHNLGVDALMISLVVTGYGMWLPSAYIVSEILEIPFFKYIGSFLAPILGSVALLVVVECARLGLHGADPKLRIAVCIAVGAIAYGATVLLLARDQLGVIRRLVAKRR